MSELEEPTPEKSRFWIWFLVVVLLVLLMVPVVSIGLAFKKSGWVAVTGPSHGIKRVSSKTDSSAVVSVTPDSSAPDPFHAIKESINSVKSVASTVIKATSLKPKMEQVKIIQNAPSDQHPGGASLEKAADAIHRVLWDRHEQFVTGVGPESIKLVVIIPSKDWPSLSSALEKAAAKEGFLYKGPTQTSSLESYDTLVAEIEIVRAVSGSPVVHLPR
jgi:hypothetical protein